LLIGTFEKACDVGNMMQGKQGVAAATVVSIVLKIKDKTPTTG